MITLGTTLAFYGIITFTFLLILGILGVPPTAIVTAFGIVIVILAITLQTSLGNLAATVIIMLFKPFKAGDVIQAGGALGVVQEIQMFSTILLAPDGKMYVVPNGVIQAGGLANYSTTGRLRFTLSFTISYESDLEKAKQILASLLAADERVLNEPPVRVFVQDLGNNGIELTAWPFVKSADFAVLQAEIVEQVKIVFDQAGIVTPRPQQDVHLYSQLNK